LKVFYINRKPLRLPPNHRFPVKKYPSLKDELLSQGILSGSELHESSEVNREIALLAHTPEYYDAVIEGRLDPRMIRQIGLPWSQRLVARVLASVGSAIDSSQEALLSGISGHLSGGTHHAFPDQGRGFCIFNDLAITTLHLLKNKLIQRAAIVDLDAHQGNGNSAILGHHPEIFIFSMHGEKSYPYRKVPSTLDIDLPEYIEDNAYLPLLKEALPQVVNFKPDIVFYLAGVDPLKDDRLGKLSLSMKGLEHRDRIVLETFWQHQIPVSIAMGGGYAQPIALTVRAHAQTYRIVKEIYQS
jgi:acetoin utilization deacetylase AcuC-like enzyme